MGHKNEKLSLIIDQNRLTALSQNGYVSHYWYDADGERTVKKHGGSMAVFVNSRQDGRVLDTQQTTAYFSPYFSIKGNCFAKHLYIGSERVVSISGELSPGDVSNSSAGGYNISHAGYGVGVTQMNIPYATKCAAMIDSAEANYAYFDLPNALEGQSRQTREFVLPAEDSENEGNSVSGTGGDGRGDASYNGNIWFIHADHLGSSTLITDGNGQLVQQIEYLPYGEVFLEKQASGSTYATPYKFNGKELDEETGLYYYGARYMNPRLSIWYGVDPISNYNPLNNENYLDGEHNGGVFNQSNLNPYCYCYDSPVVLLDPNGKQIVAVHGTWSDPSTWKDKNGIIDYVHKTFFNNPAISDFDFKWEAGNYRIYRSLAANKLITRIINLRYLHSDEIEGEPLTIVAHSHGGNVAIEAINKLVTMPEFDNIQINLLTINTPVRDDYQLNDAALQRVIHVNVYDPKDPIQSSGGHSFILLPQNPTIHKPAGEYGTAGRTFPNARNIEVNHPKNILRDFHNSHNRVYDWNKK